MSSSETLVGYWEKDERGRYFRLGYSENGETFKEVFVPDRDHHLFTVRMATAENVLSTTYGQNSITGGMVVAKSLTREKAAHLACLLLESPMYVAAILDEEPMTGRWVREEEA